MVYVSITEMAVLRTYRSSGILISCRGCKRVHRTAAEIVGGQREGMSSGRAKGNTVVPQTPPTPPPPSQTALLRGLTHTSLQSGKTKGDPAIGRLLADTVTSVPRIPPEDLERLVADNAQVWKPTLWARPCAFHDVRGCNEKP